MSEPLKPIYSPALRMKAGELEGVGQLTTDVADCILPRFIVPPSGERNKNSPQLLDLDRMPNISAPLAKVWRGRQALIDSTFILDEFGRDRASEWLPIMFERARERDVRAIPVALLSDINGCLDAFRSSVHNGPVRFGIRVPSDEMVGPEFPAVMVDALRSLNLSAADCVVIADFGDSEFSDPSIVAPIIGGSLETLQSTGLWQQIIFQGSNYPDRNPAPKSGGVEFCPRNEWIAWQLAVRFDPTTADHMIFGDYAADCSKIAFGGSGKPIRHLRYTTRDKWRIERGPELGQDHGCMHQIYAAIVGSTDFAGAGFSKADEYIAHAAINWTAPHGNAKTWRQINTTHHITQVVNDIAHVRGIRIRQSPVEGHFQMPLILQA